MESSSTTAELRWAELQRASRAQAVLDRDECRKNFALLLGLVVIVVAAAFVLAGLMRRDDPIAMPTSADAAVGGVRSACSRHLEFCARKPIQTA